MVCASTSIHCVRSLFLWGINSILTLQRFFPVIPRRRHVYWLMTVHANNRLQEYRKEVGRGRNSFRTFFSTIFYESGPINPAFDKRMYCLCQLKQLIITKIRP